MKKFRIRFALLVLRALSLILYDIAYPRELNYPRQTGECKHIMGLIANLVDDIEKEHKIENDDEDNGNSNKVS